MTHLETEVLDFSETGEIIGITALFFQCICKVKRRNTKGIRFSGGVNIGQNNMIGPLERFYKFIKQRLGTCVGMGLEDAPELLVRVVMGSV